MGMMGRPFLPGRNPTHDVNGNSDLSNGIRVVAVDNRKIHYNSSDSVVAYFEQFGRILEHLLRNHPDRP